MKFHSATLKNGLTVIGEARESAVSVALGFFVKTGARDEKAKVAGVSHFLEHMIFKGTENRSALDITYQMGAMGAQSNAFTSEESTVYYMAVLPEYFPKAFELLSDMMRPALFNEEFDVEKKVILEEIALYKDRPTYQLFECAMKTFFGEHPAGNSVLGTTESIQALSRDEMKGYFDERYAAGNIVLTVSGKFDWAEVMALAEQHCSAWPSGMVTRERPRHIPEKRSETLRKADLQRAHVMLLAPGPSADDDERYAAEILTCILGDGTGSHTYWELIDKGLADGASIESDEMDGAGILYAYASTDPDRLEEVIGVLEKVLKNARTFSDEELKRAITKTATRMVLQAESSMRRLMAVGMEWLYRADYIPLEEELRRIKSVSRESIYEMLDKYPFEISTTLRLLPAEA